MGKKLKQSNLLGRFPDHRFALTTSLNLFDFSIMVQTNKFSWNVKKLWLILEQKKKIKQVSISELEVI